jgi:hypothetical protein
MYFFHLRIKGADGEPGLPGDAGRQGAQVRIFHILLLSVILLF